MAKYAIFFSYTPETWAGMMRNPSDRPAATRKVADAMGGSLETFYFMFGDRDGFVIIDVPNAQAAAAASIAVASTGAMKHVETRELIAPEDLGAVLERARAALEQYTPPGA